MHSVTDFRHYRVEPGQYPVGGFIQIITDNGLPLGFPENSKGKLNNPRYSIAKIQPDLTTSITEWMAFRFDTVVITAIVAGEEVQYYIFHKGKRYRTKVLWKVEDLESCVVGLFYSLLNKTTPSCLAAYNCLAALFLECFVSSKYSSQLLRVEGVEGFQLFKGEVLWGSPGSSHQYIQVKSSLSDNEYHQMGFSDHPFHKLHVLARRERRKNRK